MVGRSNGAGQRGGGAGQWGGRGEGVAGRRVALEEQRGRARGGEGGKAGKQVVVPPPVEEDAEAGQRLGRGATERGLMEQWDSGPLLQSSGWTGWKGAVCPPCAAVLLLLLCRGLLPCCCCAAFVLVLRCWRLVLLLLLRCRRLPAPHLGESLLTLLAHDLDEFLIA